MMMTPRTPEQIPAIRGTLSMLLASFWFSMVVLVVVGGELVVVLVQSSFGVSGEGHEDESHLKNIK